MTVTGLHSADQTCSTFNIVPSTLTKCRTDGIKNQRQSRHSKYVFENVLKRWRHVFKNNFIIVTKSLKDQSFKNNNMFRPLCLHKGECFSYIWRAWIVTGFWSMLFPNFLRMTDTFSIHTVLHQGIQSSCFSQLENTFYIKVQILLIC